MELQSVVENITDYYFCPPPGKPVVVACAPEKIDLARALAADLERLGHPTIVPILEGETDALRQALDRLLADETIALAVLASHRVWADLELHKKLTFRNRQPSLVGKPDPLFFDAVTPLESLVRLYGADPEAIQTFLQGLKRNLQDHTPTRLTTPAGTDIQFTPRQWQPWGWELMTCPIEQSVQGVIVVDAGVFFGRVTQPIELSIENGKLSGMRCADPNDVVFSQYRQWMMEALEENPANAQAAEVGIGANPGAQISDVVMESEAVQGTVHICFGDNAIFEGMGGKNRTAWHGGTVILNSPRFEILQQAD
jgi:leucyl aminopeptidase (aminopeptidase T)